MEITQGSLAAVYQGLSAVFLEAVKEAVIPENVADLVMEAPSSSAEEQYPTTAMLGDLEELLDQYTYLNLGQFLQDVPNRFFGRVLRIPRAHIEDDKVGMHNASLRQFGRLAATHPYRRIPQLFLNAFNTAWIDGANQISTAHAWPGGQAWSNEIFGPLTVANWRVAVQMLFEMLGMDGQALGLVPTHLIVGQSNLLAARGIVSLETNAAGGANPDYDPDVKVVRWAPLSGAYANYWFVVAGGDQGRPIVVQNRQAPAVESRDNPTDTNVFYQELFEYKVSRRYGRAMVLPHLVIGSQWGAEDVTTTTQ